MRVLTRFAVPATCLIAAASSVIAHNPAAAGPAAEEVTLEASADTYVRSGKANRNSGGAQFVRVRSSGKNRALVRFDQAAIQSAVGDGTVLDARLRLTITDNGNNWGPSGRTVDVHRLVTDWTEGNGTDSSRGTGSGSTWNCAVDSEIANQAEDCGGATEWEMGQPANPSVHPWAQAPTATQTITNNQSGVVEYDVTTDVVDFLDGASDNYGWIVKKTDEGQAGMVSFGTKEGPVAAQLTISYTPTAPPVTTRVFPTTTSQMSVAIDGEHGYVAAYYDYEVVKVRLSDGATLGRFPVGASFPISLTLLNGDLYVANYGNATVARMRTSDGAVLDTYPTDNHPGTIGAFFDKLWVGNWDNGVLRAIDPATGTTVCTYSGGGRHLSVTADEQYVYTTDPALPGIRAVDPTTCQEVTSHTITLSSYPSNAQRAVGFDGTYVWSVLDSEDKVVRIDPTTQMIIDTIIVAGTPVGVVFDGLSTWVLQNEGHITRLRTSDATLIETLPVDGEPHTAYATTNQVLVGVWASPDTLLIEIGSN